ncbi:unnamed protein product, partial [Polarella glacialis]
MFGFCGYARLGNDKQRRMLFPHQRCSGSALAMGKLTVQGSGCFGRGWLQAADPPRHSRPCAVTAAGGRLSPRAAEQSCRSGRRVLPGRRLRERCPSHRRRGRFAAAAPGLRRRDVAGRQTTVPGFPQPWAGSSGRGLLGEGPRQLT